MNAGLVVIIIIMTDQAKATDMFRLTAGSLRWGLMLKKQFQIPIRSSMSGVLLWRRGGNDLTSRRKHHGPLVTITFSGGETVMIGYKPPCTSCHPQMEEEWPWLQSG